MSALKDKHIFVVEDNVSNLAVIRTILRQTGAHVPCEHWGDTTLKKMLSYPYGIDIILLDLMFPQKVTGYDVFDAIRETPELAHIPIVAVTASDPDVEMKKVRDKGFNGYISKPVDRYKFPKQLEAILNGEEVWGE